MTPFGPFEPDRILYAAGVTPNAINVVPIADGWGRHPGLTVVSEALPAACLGSIYVRTSSGGFRIFAGTADALLEYNSTTREWDDVSRAVGGVYSVPTGDRWWFVVFGANLVCGNRNDVPQFIDIDAGTEFAALAGSPPRARYAWVAGSQLVLGHHNGFPNRIMTSGYGDATWWTPGRKGCDFQDFPDGEEVAGGYGAQSGAVIFQRTMIRTMTLQSGDIPFRTDVVNPARGVIAPQSIAKIGPGRFVYLSPDGFFSGAEGAAIGSERVDRWFFSQLDRARIAEVRAFVDPDLKIAWWQTVKANGQKFRLGYCWPLNRWCYSDATFTEMASLVTPGITIEGFDSYFGAIEDIDIPMDSPIMTGGIPTLAAFNDANELCYFTGESLPATIDTADTQLSPGSRSWLARARAVSDAGTYTLRAITSDFHGGERTVGAAVSPYSRNGLCNFRSPAFLHAFRMEIPAGTVWSHAMGIDYPIDGFRPEGQQ